nr:hypothetical protein Itr_chr14CG13210 [Ipomoea trifida]
MAAAEGVGCTARLGSSPAEQRRSARWCVVVLRGAGFPGVRILPGLGRVVPENVAEEKAETAAYEEEEDGGGRRGHSSGDDGVSDAAATASCADRRG